MRPGPLNLITDVDGILVGQAEDHHVRTGVTAVVPGERVTAAADVRGGAPGTRETGTLHVASLVDVVDAVVLSGGSVFGLDAAGGAVARLAEEGRGFPTSAGRVPVVPAAILFDLANGGDKTWGRHSLYHDLGYRAVQAAADRFDLGNAGAGLGASAGTLKGGTGSASAVTDSGLQVGAIVAVNAVGSTVIPGTSTLWAALFEQAGEMGMAPRSLPSEPLDLEDEFKGFAAENTTIGVVATNATLDKGALNRIAIMAHDGLARAIRPVHTPFDGDTIFALATAKHPDAIDAVTLARLGSMASDCVTRATGRAMVAAETLDGMTSYSDWRAGKCQPQ